LEATLTLVRGKNYDGEWSSSYNVHDWAVVTYSYYYAPWSGRDGSARLFPG